MSRHLKCFSKTLLIRKKLNQCISKLNNFKMGTLICRKINCKIFKDTYIILELCHKIYNCKRTYFQNFLQILDYGSEIVERVVKKKKKKSG